MVYRRQNPLSYKLFPEKVVTWLEGYRTGRFGRGEGGLFHSAASLLFSWLTYLDGHFPFFSQFSVPGRPRGPSAYSLPMSTHSVQNLRIRSWRGVLFHSAAIVGFHFCHNVWTDIGFFWASFGPQNGQNSEKLSIFIFFFVFSKGAFSGGPPSSRRVFRPLRT